MPGEVKNLIGEEVGRVRICTMDFASASASAPAETFQASSVAGCIFHLWQSLFWKAHQIGISGKYQAGEDFRTRVENAFGVSDPPPLEEIAEGYELTEPGFPDGEQKFLTYFEATFIGRRIPAGRRSFLSGHHLWRAKHRMTLGRLRANNANRPAAPSPKELPKQAAARCTDSLSRRSCIRI